MEIPPSAAWRDHMEFMWDLKETSILVTVKLNRVRKLTTGQNK